MLFKELLRLRRHPSGLVPIEVLQALELPMPQEVLQDFVQQTGTDDLTQSRLGGIDLHALRWERPSLPASEILACSFDEEEYARFVGKRADQARRVATEGWDNVSLTSDDIESWQERKSWRRPPISVRGAVVGSPALIYLIAGFIRLGMLRGLVESKWLSADSSHEIWVGANEAPPQSDGPWHDVLRKERMPFLEWIKGHVGEKTEVGRAASIFIEIQHDITEPSKVDGNDLEAVLAFSETVPALMMVRDGVAAAHQEWDLYTSK
jgi:hypothetical protein